MTELVMPSIPGLAWGLSKKPTWRSRIQKSVSGRRVGVEYMSYPLYTWTLKFNVLRQYSTYAELALLQGFFNSMRGQVETFLYGDPSDAAAIAEPVGTGDGTTLAFQMVRTYGGVVEPVWAPNTWEVSVNGVVQSSGYTVSITGLIEFAVAPPAGHVVTWTGTFRWRCYFTQDSLELINQDGVDLWKTNNISFESFKP